MSSTWRWWDALGQNRSLDKYLQQNGVENRDAALAEFRTLRDFYNKCQDFHGDDDYILVVGIYRD